MGRNIKLNWLQKTALKFVGLSPASSPGNLTRFQSVITNLFGISALWNNEFDTIHAYECNATLYTVVTRIAEKAATAPFKVYRVKEDKKALHRKYKSWTGPDATYESLQKAMNIKSLVYEEDNNHPLNKIIEKPNESMKGNEFTINAVGFKLLTGNRMLYVPRLDMGNNQGKPAGVTPMPPQFMMPLSDGSMYGIRAWRFELARGEQNIEASEIIHSKYFNPNFSATGSHLLGLSPVRAASRNVQRGEAAENRALAMLQNAGAAGAVVDKGGTNDDLEMAYKTKAAINATVNGNSNSGKIGLLNGDYSYLNFGLTAQDMQVMETEKFSDEKICMVFGFPYGLINQDKATYSNMKEYKKELVTGPVITALSSLRDDWNEIAKMYNDDIYVDFDMSVYPEMQEDLKDTATALKDIWFITGNEKRLRIGEDEDTETPEMNMYLVPSGYVPIQQLGENFNALIDQMNEVDDTE